MGVYYAGMPSPVEGCRGKNVRVRVTGGEILAVGKARWTNEKNLERLLAKLRATGKDNGRTVVACETMGSDLTSGSCCNIYCALYYALRQTKG